MSPTSPNNINQSALSVLHRRYADRSNTIESLLSSIIFFGFLFNLSGCESPSVAETQKPQYMVNAYMIAHNIVPSVTLHTTSSVNEWYDWEKHTVEDARVQIRKLRADGSIAEIYEYYHLRKGRYYPEGNDRVQPEQQYQLFITFASGDTLEAKTTVPGDFEVISQPNSSYIYRQYPQMQWTVTPSSYPGRPAYYLFTVRTRNEDAGLLTSFYRDLILEKGQLMDLYFMNSSDITGAQNYERDPEGNLILKVPWSVFAFYGENEVTLNAVDNNIYQTWPAISPGLLTEGMTFSPDKMQTLPDHINGGIGIFGSLTRVHWTVEILRK